MPTGESRRTSARGRSAFWAVVAAALLLGGCDEIKDPEVLVVLDSSAETIRGTTPVQIFATVTEDGTPLLGNEVMFTSTRGTFSNGSATASKFSDDTGLAAETLTLADDSDSTPVEVSGTSSTDLSTFTATLTLPVEAGSGR